MRGKVQTKAIHREQQKKATLNRNIVNLKFVKFMTALC